MISNNKFIVENNLWFVMLKILDLAIIMRPAIRILSIIKVVDIVSMAEKDEIE